MVRQVAEVDRLMREGVPPGSIGLIDDAGGTMTAPILPEFEAVLCRAGTVRSHLAIISREYGVPALMGVQLRRELKTGERVRVSYSAAAQTMEAYHGGEVAPQGAYLGGRRVSDFRIDEERLLRLNTTLSRADDVIIYNCMTRTAQESKLFPLMPYLMLCFYDAYYRFPDLIREASEHVTPEQVGHRVREGSMLPSKLSAWGTLNFYLNGRASLIKLGLLRPEDNLEDLVTVVDWWERFSRSYHRNSGHEWTYDQGDIAPELPERVLQVHGGRRLRHRRAAAQGGQQVHGHRHAVPLPRPTRESRMSLQASRPVPARRRPAAAHPRLHEPRQLRLLVARRRRRRHAVQQPDPRRDHRGVGIEVTDWASAYTDPEDYQDSIVGVGLYSSDWLTDTLPAGGHGLGRRPRRHPRGDHAPR